MRYVIHPEAANEFEKVSDHYWQIQDRLGQRFEDGFDETLRRMLDHTEAWHPMGNGYRRCSFNDFPFGIIYHINSEQACCFIYAVMHFHQEPGY